ncbi:MAG: carbohydrate binding domain-containing protein [Elusimicrobiota bacterium]
MYKKLLLLIIGTLTLYALPAFCGDFGAYSSSVTIDSMDSASAWTLSNGSGDSASLSSVDTPDGTGLKLEYAIGTSGWAQLYKSVQYWSFNGTENVQFYYRKTGSSENISVKFKDSDGDLLKYPLGAVADSGGWVQATVNLSSFTVDAASVGDGSFNWASVQSFEFVIDRSEGGSGELDVDDIYVVTNNAMWDDFESGTGTNLFNGTSGTYSGSGGAITNIIVSTVVYASNKSLELRYDVTAGDAWAFYYTNGNSKNMSDMNQLKFRVKGAVGGEKMLVELKYADGSADGVRIFKEQISTTSFSGISSITTSWQQVIIDITQYTSKLSAIRNINFLFDNSITQKTGVIYIDNLEFCNNNTAELRYLDDMDTPVGNTSWSGYADTSASSALSTISGYRNGAMRMKYSLGATGTWANMIRKSSLNLSYVKAVYLTMKQSGANNYVEIKLQDSSGTVYYHKRNYDLMDSYFVLKAPLEEFTYFQGSSGATFNLREITGVWISVSRYSGTGESGNVIFGDMTAGTESDFFNDFSADDVMTKIEVINNPFTPDGNGFRDTARIRFTLGEAARMRLRIYDLKGIIIWEREGDFDSGAGEFEWDGKNNDGTLQRSGLYMYQLYADSITARKQKYSHIIGIEK